MTKTKQTSWTPIAEYMEKKPIQINYDDLIEV